METSKIQPSPSHRGEKPDIPSQGSNKRRATDAPPPNNTNSSKRSRVSRACDQCRAAREKCDGKPLCSACAISRRNCTYTTNPKKRGIQPGYIRTLELSLTWIFDHSNAEAILNQKLALEGSSSVLLAKGTKESNKLHKTWRRSKFSRDVDLLLAGGATVQDDRLPESDDQEDTDHEEQLTQACTGNLVAASGSRHSVGVASDPPRTARSVNANSGQSSEASFQISISEPVSVSAISQSQIQNSRQTNSTLIERLLPGMNPSPTITSTSPNPQRLPQSRKSSTLHSRGVQPFSNTRNPTTIRDMDSFFNEMASLEDTEMPGNKALFMQNLGLPPDANIADFLSAG